MRTRGRDHAVEYGGARRRALGRCLMLACGATLGCGTPAKSPVDAIKSPEAPPAAAPRARPVPPAFDVEAATKREASGLTEHTVHDPRGKWSVTVPSTAAPTVTTADDVVLVVVPVGPGVEVRCQVHAEVVDPAGTLLGVLKESSSRVAFKSVQPAGVKVFNGAPAAGVRASYVADAATSRTSGSLKLSIHTSEQRSLLCLLDDLGYLETFDQISGAFYASFAPTTEVSSRATYSEVTKAQLDDIDVGFGVTRLLPGDKPGEREYHQLSTHLVPESAQELSFDDAYTALKVNARGQLVSGTWAETRMGEISLNVSLTREANGKYTYEGQVDGQTTRGTLAGPPGMATPLDVAVLLKKRLKHGAPFSDTVAEYHPSVDPTSTVEVRYSRAQGDPPRQVVITLGERKLTAEVDDEGMVSRGWFDLGENQKLTISRLHQAGHL